jgi:hypothetical protein
VNAGGDAAHAEHAFVLPEEASAQQPYVASQGLHPHHFSRPHTPPGGMAPFPNELWLPPIDPPLPLTEPYEGISTGVLKGIDNYVGPVGKNSEPLEARAKVLVKYLKSEAKHRRQAEEHLFDVAMQSVKLNCGNNTAHPAWRALRLALPAALQAKYPIEEAEHKYRAPEAAAVAVAVAAPVKYAVGPEHMDGLLAQIVGLGKALNPDRVAAFTIAVKGVITMLSRQPPKVQLDGHRRLDLALNDILKLPNVEKSSFVGAIRALQTQG